MSVEVWTVEVERRDPGALEVGPVDALEVEVAEMTGAVQIFTVEPVAEQVLQLTEGELVETGLV